MLYRGLSAREVVELRAFYMLEPRSDSRMDLLFAKLSAVIANMVRGKDASPFSVSDFLLRFEIPDDDELEEPSEIDIELMQRMIASPKERRSG